MVAMYHTIVGIMSDGTEERHTSRLITYGDSDSGSDIYLNGDEGQGKIMERGGDSAMSETVGYTLGASVELLLQIHPNKFQEKNAFLSKHPLPELLKGPLGGKTGVLIPTTADIYEPILERLKDFGLNSIESVTVNVPKIENKKK